MSQLRLLFEKTAKIRSHRIPRVFCLYFKLQLFFFHIGQPQWVFFFFFSSKDTQSDSTCNFCTEKNTRMNDFTPQLLYRVKKSVHFLFDVPKMMKFPILSRCCMNATDKSLRAISSGRLSHVTFLNKYFHK